MGISSNSHVSQGVALVMETRAKMHRLVVSKNGCANLIDPSAVDSTKQDVLGL